MSFSWNGDMQNGDWILNLKFRAKRDLRLSEAIAINSAVTPALSVTKESKDEAQLSHGFRGSVANEFIVLPNEPNPWNQSTTIGMLLPDAGEVSITVYDVTGKIFLSEKRQMNRGYNEYILHKDQLNHSGVYYYQVDYLNNTVSRKMIISD
jgi:hypothetical protein